MQIKENSSKRIFWLGMHVVLVKTELQQLRKMGFEVFNPRYFSKIKDQSAQLDWDETQHTTLPKEVFNKLADYDFFYTNFSKSISNILNKYFDIIIVTISPEWLRSVLDSDYKGKIIFRTYGATYSLSEELKRQNLLSKISCHNDFIFMPHAVETLKNEHSWLKSIAKVTPYCVSDDIFCFENTWGNTHPKKSEIVALAPNITNSYYYEHYCYLKEHFGENHFRYYGKQIIPQKDPQIVGNLSRSIFIKSFQQSAGFLYTYTDPGVCYLPPIEMMILGGPVLFMKGSLLDEYFDKQAPGRCNSVKEAKEKVKRLLSRDKAFIDSIIFSQEEVKKRYHPSYVLPIFERNILDAIHSKHTGLSFISDRISKTSDQKKRIYFLHHFPHPTVVFKNGVYTAFDGIVRVNRKIIDTLGKHTKLEIIITVRRKDADLILGYFNDFSEKNKHRIKVLIIDEGSAPYNLRNKIKKLIKQYTPDNLIQILIKTKNIKYFSLAKWKSFFKKKAPPSLLHILITLKKIIPNIMELFILKIISISKKNNKSISKKILINLAKPILPFFSRYQTFKKINEINNDPNCIKIVVPHYSFFPESLSLGKDLYMYLPDYMPHFFHKSGEFKLEEGLPTAIGKAIAEKAKVVYCNSNFTKDYLPISRLKVNKEKIKVFYLPVLNKVDTIKAGQTKFPDCLSKHGYIFYPTQPHPNKNLALLLNVFSELICSGKHIKLVLTAPVSANQKAHKTYLALPKDVQTNVIFKGIISDQLMEVLYKNAALVCCTTMAEGNFPPQILEALSYNTPVVAPNLGFISERIPSHLDGSLKLCKPDCLEDYVKSCREVLENRAVVIEKQKELFRVLLEESKSFKSDLIEIFD